MTEYILRDKDKAAFISRMNKILNQIQSGLELSSENFIDIPDMGEGSDNDMTIFITDEPIHEKILDLLISKRKLSYKVKKVKIKDITESL